MRSSALWKVARHALPKPNTERSAPKTSRVDRNPETSSSGLNSSLRSLCHAARFPRSDVFPSRAAGASRRTLSLEQAWNLHNRGARRGNLPGVPRESNRGKIAGNFTTPRDYAEKHLLFAVLEAILVILVTRASASTRSLAGRRGVREPAARGGKKERLPSAIQTSERERVDAGARAERGGARENNKTNRGGGGGGGRGRRGAGAARQTRTTAKSR